MKEKRVVTLFTCNGLYCIHNKSWTFSLFLPFPLMYFLELSFHIFLPPCKKPGEREG